MKVEERLTRFVFDRMVEDGANSGPDQIGPIHDGCNGVQILRGDRWVMGGCNVCGMGPCRLGAIARQWSGHPDYDPRWETWRP